MLKIKLQIFQYLLIILPGIKLITLTLDTNVIFFYLKGHLSFRFYFFQMHSVSKHQAMSFLLYGFLVKIEEHRTVLQK